MAMDDPLRRTMVVAPRGSTPSAMIEATGLKCGVLIVVHDMTGLMMCRTETVTFENCCDRSCAERAR